MDDTAHEPQPTAALPVPAQRRDGWTADRQETFLRALAACGCVREACKAVGMSNVSAYRLRARPSAMAFRLAWDAALDCAMTRLEEAALSRAIDGVARPVFYKGEQVGEWRHHDERLAMFLLRYRRSHRYQEQPPLPPVPSLDPLDDQPDPDEAMATLEWHLGELTDHEDAPLGQAPRAWEGANFANFAPDCDASDGTLEPHECPTSPPSSSPTAARRPAGSTSSTRAASTPG